MIYRGRVWRAYRERDWILYRVAVPHFDRVHFSFSSAGANGETGLYRDHESATPIRRA